MKFRRISAATVLFRRGLNMKNYAYQLFFLITPFDKRCSLKSPVQSKNLTTLLFSGWRKTYPLTYAQKWSSCLSRRTGNFDKRRTIAKTLQIKTKPKQWSPHFDDEKKEKNWETTFKQYFRYNDMEGFHWNCQYFVLSDVYSPLVPFDSILMRISFEMISSSGSSDAASCFAQWNASCVRGGHNGLWSSRAASICSEKKTRLLAFHLKYLISDRVKCDRSEAQLW